MIIDQPSSLALTIIGPLTIAIAVAIVAMVIAKRRASTAVVDRERVVGAQAEWRAPDALANASLPRPVKFTGTSLALAVVVALVLAGSGVLGWLAARAADREKQTTELLQHEGVVTQASITRQWIGGGKNRAHNVDYTYNADDGPHRATARVSTPFYNRVAPGSTAQVTYVRSNPAINRIEHGVVTPPWTWLLVFVPFVAILFVPYIVWQQKKLLEYGTPAGAVVERVSPMKGGYMIAYQFLATNGDTVKGRCSSREKRAPGDTITIVYDPERPKRSERYPLKFVKLSEGAL